MAGQGGVEEFRKDDDGYRAWLATHPEGYVTNILGAYSLTTARTHRAVCHTIHGRPPRGGMWTGPKYVKWCAQRLADLDQRAVDLVGGPAPRCGTCLPGGAAGQAGSRVQTHTAGGGAPGSGRWRIHGPTPDTAVVQAWAEDYVRFEKLPDWQQDLRAQIRRRCGELVPSAGQVMHAQFFGEKLANADVENLVLYNIDTFRAAGRHGIRFEHGQAVPPGPDGSQYRVGYRYALAPRTASFTRWREGRTLAEFGWTDLGAFAGEKKLAQVWRAITGGQHTAGDPVAAGAPFAVCVQVRPPFGLGREPVWGGLVKGIFDGVICAFHSHHGPLPPRENMRGLADELGIAVGDLEDLLGNPRWGVLGEVPALVSAYRGGVKWAPSDHLCVAGELLAADPAPGQDHWAITGRIVAVTD